MDAVLTAAQDLITALQHPSPVSLLTQLSDQHRSALHQLSDIFHDHAAPTPLLPVAPVPLPASATAPLLRVDPPSDPVLFAPTFAPLPRVDLPPALPLPSLLPQGNTYAHHMCNPGQC